MSTQSIELGDRVMLNLVWENTGSTFVRLFVVHARCYSATVRGASRYFRRVLEVQR